jgi:hypothetical protein
MIDDNIKMDYSKVNRLALSFKSQDIIDKIIEEEEIISNIISRFNLHTMFKEKENIISLFYYLGMLTIEKSVAGLIKFVIPNYAIKTVYWESIRGKLINEDILINMFEIQNTITKMVVNGEIEEYIKEVKKILEECSNRDLMKFDEKYIKTIMFTLLSLDSRYIIDSEYETNKGYVDIYLRKPRPLAKEMKYEWLIELKYLKVEDRGKLEKVIKEGKKQIESYKNSRKFEQKFLNNNIKCYLLIFIGKSEYHIIEV